jgi:hypothetical protein
MLESLEELYWKYASVVIDRIQFGKSMVTDELSHMVKMIHSKQHELSIAIAHHRTLSINVVETVMRSVFYFLLIIFNPLHHPYD